MEKVDKKIREEASGEVLLISSWFKLKDKKPEHLDSKIVELASQYYEDSKYYVSKEDYFTAFGCINYGHGLLDAILKF